MIKLTNAQITAVAAALLIAALLLHGLDMHGARDGVLIAVTAVAGLPIAMKALRALRMRVFSIELLVTIAVTGALIIGEYVESAAVTFLFIFGAWLEARTLEKTRASLRRLIDMTPVEATVIRDGRTLTVPAEDVVEGDRVLVRSGEKIAVDGPILSGHALVVEAAITGESVPASKAVGDPVYGGTVVDHGYIEVEAQHVGADTTFSRIIELVENAQESKTRTQKFLDRFATVYTPGIAALSVLVWLWSGNVELALTFLVIACPGALVISAPVSMVAGIGNGARRGVLIKGGEVMEKLARINMVLFDKTGTLTRGRPEVTGVHAWSRSGDELLGLVAQAEIASEHHLGQTIVAEARRRSLVLDNEPQEVQIIKGQGLLARVGDDHLTIGNRALMQAQGIAVDEDAQAHALAREEAGNTAILVGVNGRLEGIIAIADQVRPEAAEAIGRLRQAGVERVIMLTGDNRHTARLVADELGLDEAHAELLPQDKLDWVRRLQGEGWRVAMAGDGINDAPALAMADVGLAMGVAGTDISMETADVVLMTDRLDQFAHARSLAAATVRNMKQNTVLALGTVVLLLAGVLLGKVHLASGMLIHELSVLAVILNAVRLIRYGSRAGRHSGLSGGGLPDTGKIGPAGLSGGRAV